MEDMTLNRKIIELRKLVEVIKKDGKGYSFKYVSEGQILRAIKEKMNELGVILIPSVVPGTINHEFITYTEQTKNGDKIRNMNIVTADMIFTWKDDNEKLEVPFALFGQMEGASQSFGSALTYASRYFLLKFFQIETTEDDPDRIKYDREQEALNNKYEIYDCIYIYNSQAIKIVKSCVGELFRKMGVVKQEVAERVERDLWTSLEELNLMQLIKLEDKLKTLNCESNDWHDLYDRNSRTKKTVIGKNIEVQYESSLMKFAKLAFSMEEDVLKKQDIIDYYLNAGFDVSELVKKEE